jgi:Histidine kinase-, DNA gyrase B-, and HSP90-like ATPase
MNRKLVNSQGAANTWRRRTSPVTVGKDLLGLLSSSMYIDPMAIYREYLQNATDSVDEARRLGVLSMIDPGRVDIFIDSNNRTVRILDNGTGISRDRFEECLTSFGKSFKRGTGARGFRGIGRLAGLGYCQELYFRSRASGDATVIEMRWNCKSIKSILLTAEAEVTLHDLVNSVVDVRTIDADQFPEHFFEVELRGVVRHKSDLLLNATAIYDYLSEVAPVPFHPDFKFGEAITSALTGHVAIGGLHVQIQGMPDPVYRPHRSEIEVNGTTHDRFTDLEICEIPSIDGSLCAIGWFLHHGYKGAIPAHQIRGLRLRSGNLQVGGHDSLQDLFSESRFNSWTVGEIHTIDNRILPNGRRDHYEQNAHLNNLINHLAPLARRLSTRCRQSSIVRNSLREFERQAALAQEKMSIAKQGSMNPAARKTLLREVQELLTKMRRTATRESLSKELRKSLGGSVGKLEKTLGRLSHSYEPAKALSQLSPSKRKTYQQVFALIYACSTNQASAQSLIERILNRLSEANHN